MSSVWVFMSSVNIRIISPSYLTPIKRVAIERTTNHLDDGTFGDHDSHMSFLTLGQEQAFLLLSVQPP
jgi:hypothetical protein